MALYVFLQECDSEAARLTPRQHFKVLFMVVLLSVFSGVMAVSAASDPRHIATDDLVAIRDIQTMAISPDGNYVAYQVVQADKNKNDYDISWHVAATKTNAKPIMVADEGGAGSLLYSSGVPVGGVMPSEIVWSPDSEWVYFSKTLNGAVQIWRSHRSRYGQEQVTNNAADIEGPKFSKDGSKLFFAVGRNRLDLVAANQREAKHGYLVQEPVIYSVEDGPYWPPCSDNRKRLNMESNKNRTCVLTIWVYDIEAGVERRATADEIDAYYAEDDTSINALIRRGKLKDQDKVMEIVSPDGKRLAWFENEDPDIFKGYYPPRWLVVSGVDETFRCSAKACRSTRPIRLWWSASGEEVIFLVRNGYHNSLTSLYSWVPGETEVRTILSNDNVLYNCDIADDQLICGHESWTSPRKIVSIDLDNGEIATIADMNPEFQNFTFTKIEKVLGEDAYGNPAHAHLVYPKDYQEGQRYPLIIVQYRSRGFLRGGVGDEHPIHVLAQNGFAVLSFDMPHQEDDYAKNSDMLNLRISNFRYHMVDGGPATAIERMLEELDKRGVIDSTRVGITGLSAGAMTVDTAMLRRNYAAASAAYSMTAPPNFDLPASSDLSMVMDGAYGGAPFSEIGFDTRVMHSVGMNANRIDTPLLIQVADREYQWTRQNYHALKAAGKPVEMYIFPNEYHVKWQPAHRYTVYTRNIDWFKFWLMGEEDDDPAKRMQYQRWQSLREQHYANLQTLFSER